jgi:hypothetical protein
MKSEVKLTQSQFEDDLSHALNSVGWLDKLLAPATMYFKDRNVSELISTLDLLLRYNSNVQEFVEKYDKFLEVVEAKFNIELSNSTKVLRTNVIGVKNTIVQTKQAIAKRKFNKSSLSEVAKAVANLKVGFDELSVLPQKIDYSLLGNQEWRLIGIPAIHYKAKVFLSYFYRDNDPKKDENEGMINTYVKPVLEYLDIVPVSLRDQLQAQDKVIEKAENLIADADGIIGFYTKGDSVENVEHELSLNKNIVAIFTETGAKGPSMRRSEWQLEFSRGQMGDLILALVKALKNKQLFRLVV